MLIFCTFNATDVIFPTIVSHLFLSFFYSHLLLFVDGGGMYHLCNLTVSSSLAFIMCTLFLSFNNKDLFVYLNIQITTSNHFLDLHLTARPLVKKPAGYTKCIFFFKRRRKKSKKCGGSAVDLLLLKRKWKLKSTVTVHQLNRKREQFVWRPGKRQLQD